MFGNYFGQYLVEKNGITKEQLLDVKETQKSARVKLGLIAVESGFMTQQQADEVNMLQQQMDKRFGDIAVEKGYLTEDQLSDMLSKQGDDYLTFVQAMTDNKVMSLQQVQEQVDEFKAARGYTDDEMDALKSGDLDRIVPIFMKEESLTSLHKNYIALIMRNIMRLIDSDISMKDVVKVSKLDARCGVQQQLFGAADAFTGIFGEEAVMLDIASTFGREDFKEIDEDSLDAVCEFLNVCNGMFVSEESEGGEELDLHPPMMYPEAKSVSCEEGAAYMIPVTLSGKDVTIILSVNAKVTVA